MKLSIKRIELYVETVTMRRKRKNKSNTTLIQNQHWQIVNVSKMNIGSQTLFNGPTCSGKSFLRLKILSRIPD